MPEILFSPATSTSVVKLIPLLFLIWRATRPEVQYGIASIDVKDAFLEVPQQTPLVANMPSDLQVVGDTSFSDVFQVRETDHGGGSSSMWTTYVLT